MNTSKRINQELNHSETDFSPKRITCTLDVSKITMKKSRIAEKALIDCLCAALAAKIENVIGTQTS